MRMAVNKFVANAACDVFDGELLLFGTHLRMKHDLEKKVAVQEAAIEELSSRADACDSVAGRSAAE